jgi:hypothetical protein
MATMSIVRPACGVHWKLRSRGSPAPDLTSVSPARTSETAIAPGSSCLMSASDTGVEVVDALTTISALTFAFV